ncbi:MAG: CDP-glycerol glycerophosphotransferase family protein [Deltaproteobacteria bacterium]|nr:CDP-glycerol glycerophosphotransferase family protein [Deltaproteobacteria bacterium]
MTNSIKTDKPKRILFSGYAPVHFLCFLPIYELLKNDPRVEVWLSGGFRNKDKDETTFNIEGFYDPYPVDKDRVIPIEQAREEDFDVLVCAHLSDTLFPRSAKKTVQIFHGVSFKNLAVREKALRFDVLCLPGPYHAELFRSQGFIRKGGSECLLTGFAKTDALINETLDRNELLRGLDVDPALPTLLFAPTGDKHNALESMGEKLISSISDAGKWNLLIKPHDHPKNVINWFERLKPFENERVKVVRDLNVIPYLHAADLLITDASSVSVEYTLMDRPIIFLEIPKLMAKITKRAEALDLDSRRIGTIIDKKADIVETITESLAQKEQRSELRREVASQVFYKPGGASDRIKGVILHAAEIEKELPDDVKVLLPE